MSTQVFTLANQLTMLRMLLVPVFVLLTLYGEFGWALLTFMFAGVTDLLDGLAARTTGGQTDLGAWLDPIADKLLIGATFVVLTLPNIGLVNRLPLWLTITVLSRDVGILLTVAIVNLAIGPRTFRPSPLGKLATAVFVLSCVVVMYFNFLGHASVWVDVAVWTSLLITIASWVDYVWRLARIFDETPVATLKAWQAFHVADDAAPLLSKRFVDTNWEFRSKFLNGTEEQRPRWKRGISAVEGEIGELLGQVYARRYFPAATQGVRAVRRDFRARELLHRDSGPWHPGTG